HGDLQYRKLASGSRRQRTSHLEQFMASDAAPKRAAQTISLPELNSDKSEEKSTERKLRELSVRFIALQDFERRRIARELHDCTGQTVALLKMNLDRLAQLGQLSLEQARVLCESVALAEEVRTQLRTISY